MSLTLPNEIIFGVAYNTNTWGYNPIGQPGPYESLNVGTANVNNVGVPPTVGTDVEPDATFWNTSVAGFYSDGGAGGVGTFRRDTSGRISHRQFSLPPSRWRPRKMLVRTAAGSLSQGPMPAPSKTRAIVSSM